MTFTISDLRSLHPFDPAKVRSVYSAIACYIVFVAAITVLSIFTGAAVSLIAGGHVGVVVMRLLNGFVTGYLGYRIINARDLKASYWVAIAGAAALFSAIGYEVIGLAIIAALTCRTKAEV